MSLAQIGEEAGCSRGLVNHHFGSKAMLIERLVELVQVEFSAAAQSAILCESALDRILGLTRTFLGMLEELPPIHRAFLVLWADAVVAPSGTRNAMADSDRGFREAVAEEIEGGIRAGTIRPDVSPKGFATALVGQLRGVALQVLVGPGGFDLGEVRSEIERGLRHSLCAVAGSATEQGIRHHGSRNTEKVE